MGIIAFASFPIFNNPSFYFPALLLTVSVKDINFLLFILRAAYTEFDDRLVKLKSPRESKTQLIKAVIQRRRTHQFFQRQEQESRADLSHITSSTRGADSLARATRGLR